LDLLLVPRLLLLLAEEEDDDAGLAGFLRASHLSSESARPSLLLPLLDDADVAAPARALFFLLSTHFSDEEARGGLLLLLSEDH